MDVHVCIVCMMPSDSDVYGLCRLAGSPAVVSVSGCFCFVLSGGASNGFLAGLPSGASKGFFCFFFF